MPRLLARVQNIRDAGEGMALSRYGGLAFCDAPQKEIGGDQGSILDYETRMGITSGGSHHWQDDVEYFHLSRQESGGISLAD